MAEEAADDRRSSYPNDFMSDANKLGLGQIIETEQQRDAIHIAVAPVIAGEKLSPGDHVGFLPDGRVGEAAAEKIGAVDPFLKKTVKAGERLWLFLYPGTISGLRHEWTHPAFKTPSYRLDGPPSEQWLRDYADKMGVDYDDLIQHARDYLDHSAYWIEGGRFEGEGVPDAFWTHFEVVTGRAVEESQRRSFFSCSC